MTWSVFEEIRIKRVNGDVLRHCVDSRYSIFVSRAGNVAFSNSRTMMSGCRGNTFCRSVRHWIRVSSDSETWKCWFSRVKFGNVAVLKKNLNRRIADWWLTVSFFPKIRVMLMQKYRSTMKNCRFLECMFGNVAKPKNDRTLALE